MKVLGSSGENEAWAYAVIVVPPVCPEPFMDTERVRIADPRLTATAPRGIERAGSGPRDPGQTAWPPPKAPGVDLPDGLPATKAQRVHIDPELVAQWRAEAKMKETA